MSDVRSWIASRQPPAPMSLDRWVTDAHPRADATDALTRVAVAAMTEARRAPGRVRESAFALLAADALFTWACEAALESDDAEDALGRVLSAAAGP